MAVTSGAARGHWAGILAGPFAFLLNLQINYMLVDLVCQEGYRFVLHAVALACLLLTVGGAFLSWRLWHETGAEWPGDLAGPVARGRFMAFWGLLSNSLFFFVVLGQWIPIFVLNPCLR
jgi:hypothetical protein